MAIILIRKPRHLMGFGDDVPPVVGTPCIDAPCGASTSVSDPSTWPSANTCGPSTVPYQINGRVVCLPEDAVSGYPKLPYVDVNGWRMAQVDGQPVMGADSYVCGPGTGQAVVGPNVGCTPGGQVLAITADGRVVIAAGQSPGNVFMPSADQMPTPPMTSQDPTTAAPVVIDAQVPSAPGGQVYVNPQDVSAIANQSGADVAQAVVDQVTDLANSPEAAAVVASVQNQVGRNPLPFVAALAGGWFKGFWGAMIAGAAAYYLTRPKVQVAVDSSGAALVVDPNTAAQAQAIGANAGVPVNVAGYAGWR